MCVDVSRENREGFHRGTGGISWNTGGSVEAQRVMRNDIEDN